MPTTCWRACWDDRRAAFRFALSTDSPRSAKTHGHSRGMPMKRRRLITAFACTALLAGCATTTNTRYAAAPGVYADGNYIPAQDGNGDYYYDDTPAAPVYGSFSVGFGFGSGGWGPGWYGPGFGPWGWNGWGWGPGWGPWGYGGWGSWWYGPPSLWPHPPGSHRIAPPSVPPFNRSPGQVIQRQGRVFQPNTPSRGSRLRPMPPSGHGFREPRHDFHHERPR